MRFTKEVTVSRLDYNSYGSTVRRNVQVQRPNIFGYMAIGLATLPVVVGVFGDRFMDITGDANRAKPIATAKEAEELAVQDATSRYIRTFEKASPAGKFALQYLVSTNVQSTVQIHETNNGSGIAGYLTGGNQETQDFEVQFNNGCLNQTSYDIDGGDITGTISGVFTVGSIEGEVPTAAASAFVDSTDQDMLIVSSGHTNSRDLKFQGLAEGPSLSPADQQTKDVLATYGCKTGVQQGSSKVDGYSDSSSPWVVQ